MRNRLAAVYEPKNGFSVWERWVCVCVSMRAGWMQKQSNTEPGVSEESDIVWE